MTTQTVWLVAVPASGVLALGLLAAMAASGLTTAGPEAAVLALSSDCGWACSPPAGLPLHAARDPSAIGITNRAQGWPSSRLALPRACSPVRAPPLFSLLLGSLIVY